MNIQHNTSRSRGVPFGDQMIVGQVYLSLAPSSEPRVYLACTNPGQPALRKVAFLVNLDTGCRVVPAVTSRYGYKHLPDATLDTGT